MSNYTGVEKLCLFALLYVKKCIVMWHKTLLNVKYAQRKWYIHIVLCLYTYFTIS